VTTGRPNIGFASLLLLACACAPKRAQAPAPPPPAPKPSILVLLADPEGKPSSIVLTNAAGTQTISEPNQAIRVQTPDAPPSAPVAMDQAEIQKAFGSLLDALPAAEAVFTLYFETERDVPLAEAQKQLPAILDAIRQRRSTVITVIGHTDTTADPTYNYQLGLRRAQGVATFLRTHGVDSSSLMVSSHGDTDLAIKTARGVAQARNRRVEVIVQ
jgi:outer membrane protein OmpA-like peptidoglycan-associated protein